MSSALGAEDADHADRNVGTREVHRPRPVTRRVRVGFTRRWLLAAVIIPLLMGLVGAYGLRNNVENNLEKRVERELLGRGLSTVSVQVDGRDVTAVVPGKIAPQRVKQVIEDVQGVRDVEVKR